MCDRARHRVLIVEDDADLRGDLLEILGEEGHDVAAVENGAQALELLATDPLPCVVLLDLSMPVVDGWDVLARARGDARLRDLPVIIVSAYDPPPGELHLRKPTALPALLAAVERSCARGE